METLGYNFISTVFALGGRAECVEFSKNMLKMK